MHLLEHPLSGIYDIAHGAGLSITIPAWMKWKSKKDVKKLARFAENVLGIKAGSPELTAEKGISALKEWFDKIGSPTSFAAADIPESDIDMIADHTRKLAEIWGLNDYTKDVIIELYRLCLD
jgi:hypothetical protein